MPPFVYFVEFESPVVHLSHQQILLPTVRASVVIDHQPPARYLSFGGHFVDVSFELVSFQCTKFLDLVGVDFEFLQIEYQLFVQKLGVLKVFP